MTLFCIREERPAPESLKWKLIQGLYRKSSMIGFFCRHSLFDRIKLWRNKIEDDGVKFLVVNEVKRNSFLYEKTFNYDLDERRLATLPHLWIISSRRWKNEDSISLSYSALLSLRELPIYSWKPIAASYNWDNCDFVDGSTINAHPPGAILLRC